MCERKQKQVGSLDNAQGHRLDEIGVCGLDDKVDWPGKEVGLRGDSQGCGISCMRLSSTSYT